MIGLKTMGKAARLRHWFVLALCYFGSVIASRSCSKYYRKHVTNDRRDFLCLHAEVSDADFSADFTETNCNKLDGMLVMPKTQQMLTLILNVALEAGEYQKYSSLSDGYLFWIGLSRVGTQDKFVWADGTDLTWASAPWDKTAGAKQPDLTIPNSCVAMKFIPGQNPLMPLITWHTLACSTSIKLPGFMCQSRLQCSPGEYSANMTSCATCEPGKYSKFASTSCTSCSAGRYSSFVNGGVKEAEVCPIDNSNSTTCCTACPAGTYLDKEASLSKLDCLKCPRGYWSKEGSASCRLIPAGMSAPTSSSLPTYCTKGTYSEIGASTCRLCPIDTYNDEVGQSACRTCPKGRLTNEEGSDSIDSCVSPQMNFIQGVVTLVISTGVAWEYVFRGRFASVAFFRKQRITSRLKQQATRIASYIMRYEYKAEAQRYYRTHSKVLRVFLFYLAGTMAICGVVFLGYIAIIGKLVFKATIVLSGLKFKLTEDWFETLRSLESCFREAFHSAFLSIIFFLPFATFLNFLANFEFEKLLESVNVTCSGSEAPSKLMVNLFILGVVICIIQSDLAVYKNVVHDVLRQGFQRIVLSIKYKTWSPKHHVSLKKRTMQMKVNAERGLLGSLTKTWSAYCGTTLSKSATIFDTHMFEVIFVCIFVQLLSMVDIFQGTLQVLASKVNLGDFVDREYVGHPWDEDCNHVDNYPNFDTGLAIGATALAWVMLAPSLYLISSVLIPGLPPFAKPFMPEHRTGQRVGSLGIDKFYSRVWKHSSIIALDLWGAELAHWWLNFLTRHTPYDGGDRAPSVAHVEGTVLDPTSGDFEEGTTSYPPKREEVYTSFEPPLGEDDEIPRPSYRITGDSVINPIYGGIRIESGLEMTPLAAINVPCEGPSKSSAFAIEEVDEEMQKGKEVEEYCDKDEGDLEARASSNSTIDVDDDRISGDSVELDMSGRLRARPPLRRTLRSSLFQPMQEIFDLGERAREMISELEKPESPTFRVLISKVDDDKQILRLFKSTRIVHQTYVWEEISIPDLDGKAYYSLICIETTTGEIQGVKSYEAWSFKKRQPAIDIANDLNSQGKNTTVVLVKWGTSEDDDVNRAEVSMEHMRNFTPDTKEKRLKKRRRSTKETTRAETFKSLIAEKMDTELKCASNLAESIAWCGGDATKMAFASSYVLVGTPLRKVDMTTLLNASKVDSVPIAYQQWHTLDSKIYETNYYGNTEITEVEMSVLGDDHLCDILMLVPLFGQQRLQIIRSQKRSLKSHLCFDKKSFIMAPVNPRSDVETIQWRREVSKTLPSYLYLCKLELDEIVAKHGIVNKRFKMLLYGLVVFGFGHIYTEIGRRAYYIVFWKCCRFLLLCLGYWTDDVVALYGIHETLEKHSLVWRHPFYVLQRKLHYQGRESKKYLRDSVMAEVRESTRRRDAESDLVGRISVDRDSMVNEKDYGDDTDAELYRLDEEVDGEAEEDYGDDTEAELYRLDEEVDGEAEEGDASKDETLPVETRGPLYDDIVFRSSNTSSRASKDSGKIMMEKEDQVDEDGEEIGAFFGEEWIASWHKWWIIAAYHYYETSTFRKLNAETLKVMFADDYTSLIKTIVSTRSTILLILPGFSILAIFANFTSVAPLLVYSSDLEVSLHEIMCQDPEGMARRTEEEFTDMINDIRMKELHEGDFCIDIPPEVMQLSSTDNFAYSIRKNIESYNVRAQNTLKRCLDQDPLLVKEWVIKLKSLIFFVTKSRLIIFMYELANFCLIMALLFSMRHKSSLSWFVAISVLVNIPMILIKSLPVYIVIGKILSITDVDIEYFHNFVLNLIMCRLKCDDDQWFDDEDDNTWDYATEEENVGWEDEDDEDEDFFGCDSDEEEDEADDGRDRSRSLTLGWSMFYRS